MYHSERSLYTHLSPSHINCCSRDAFKSSDSGSQWNYVYSPAKLYTFCCCLVAKSCLTLWRHGLQHARLLCPSLSHGVCLNSCSLSWWCCLTISSFASLLLLPTIFPSIRVFSNDRLFISGGQSTGASLSASILPMNIQGWFPLGLKDLILMAKGLSRVFSSITIQKHRFFGAQPSLWSKSHINTWLLEKP